MMTARLRRALHLAAVLGMVLFTTVHAAGPQRSNFDHLRTGFPLTGAHALASCETCHAGGVFKGTPTRCESCHMRGGRTTATAKPSNHVPTTLPCDDCHRSAATWSGARFSHLTVAPGSCQTCHNGAFAPGKPANHMPTASACDTCHRTLAWAPTRYNHADVAPGSCATCHNGSTARGKPANHVQTTASCDSCHRTSGWLPASFGHSSVTPGSCATCHNGSTATGKPGGHFVTTQSCDACHTTSAWTPVSRYTHISPNYRPHNSAVTCLNCHTGNSETATWTYSAYKPDCAGCHAGKFKIDAHKKTETPTTVFYSVTELKDCSGSCHLYTDNTFTTILKSRSGQHRSTASGF